MKKTRYTRRCPECGHDDWMFWAEITEKDFTWVYGVPVTPLIGTTKTALNWFRTRHYAYLNVCQCGLVVS